MDLSLAHLRAVNKARARRYHRDGVYGWSLADWLTELAGEVGEAANLIKKLRRIESGMAGNKPALTEKALRQDLEEELADVLISLDLLAARAGISLSEAAIKKFNQTSSRLGMPNRLLALSPDADAIARSSRSGDFPFRYVDGQWRLKG